VQPKSKIYVLVRGDISPGYQLAQSCHAALRFAVEHPEVTREWMDCSEYICCLSVEDPRQLKVYAYMAEQLGIKVSRFFEPDIGDKLTAIALEPSKLSQNLCRGLPLALSEVKNDEDGHRGNPTREDPAGR
jgi:hypothetical protein